MVIVIVTKEVFLVSFFVFVMTGFLFKQLFRHFQTQQYPFLSLSISGEWGIWWRKPSKIWWCESER